MQAQINENKARDIAMLYEKQDLPTQMYIMGILDAQSLAHCTAAVGAALTVEAPENLVI